MATIRDLLIGVGYDLDQKSVKAVEGSINSIKSFATKALGVIGIGFSLVKLKEISELYNGINDSLRDATRGMGEQKDIQQTVLKYSKDARQSYADMSDIVGKLARNTENFGGVEDAANFASLMFKDFRATGKSASESNALVKQMTTSLSKGVADSRVMMSLFRESPGTLRMMAESLGVSIDTLKDMMSKGQVSAKMMKEAFEKNAGSIQDRFEELDFTISDAMQSIRDDWGLFVDEMNSSLGITKTIAKYMVIGFGKVMDALKKVQEWVLRVSNKLGGMKNMLKLIGIVGGTIFAALNAKKILAFLGSVKKLLTFTTLKIMAVVAAVVLLALLVEDFMAFLRGDNSFIGEMLKKAGIDVDETREKILAAWNTIKDSLARIWGKIKSIVSSVFGSIKKYWDKWGEETATFLIETVGNAFDGIMALLDIFSALLSGDWEGLWEGVKNFFTSAWEQIKLTVTEALDRLYDIFGPWLAIILGVTAAVLAYKGAMTALSIAKKIQTGVTTGLATAQKLLNIAMSANPIGIVIALIVGLVTAFVILWNKSEGFRNFFIGMWEGIKTAFGAVVDFFKGAIESIVKFFQPLLVIIDKVSDFVGGAMKKVGDFVGKIFGGGKDDDKPKPESKPKPGSPESPVRSDYASVISSYPAFAGGTKRTPDTFIAGDGGPELITGAKGRTVFTALQTGDIFQTLKDIVSLGARPSPAMVNGMASSVENKSIIQNVEINNKFEGERAGQKKSAEAMDKAADDTIGQLSRALTFARG